MTRTTFIHATRPSRLTQLKRFLRWFWAFVALVALVMSTVYVFNQMRTTDAQREVIFMQGMSAGFSMCGVGI